jgi:hypothetical protein
MARIPLGQVVGNIQFGEGDLPSITQLIEIGRIAGILLSSKALPVKTYVKRAINLDFWNSFE